jgi:hypothetical protein
VVEANVTFEDPVCVSSAEPLPPEPVSKASVLNVLGAETTKRNWRAKPAPIDMAVPSVGLGVPSPKEATLKFLDLLENLFSQCIDQQLVDGVDQLASGMRIGCIQAARDPRSSSCSASYVPRSFLLNKMPQGSSPAGFVLQMGFS